MAKLQIIQAVLAVTWCIMLCNTSEAAIKNKNNFIQFMERNVIPPFQRWTQGFGPNSHQFAVMLLMDSNSNWNTFNFVPSIDQKKDINCRELPCQMVNYFAALPKNGQHSEQRIINKFHELLMAYKHNKKGHNPKAVVLYTWYLPCCSRLSQKYKYKTCTTLLSDFEKQHLAKAGVKFIVAYTKLAKENGEKFIGCEINSVVTTKAFKDAGIELVKVPYNRELESLIERIMQNMLLNLIM